MVSNTLSSEKTVMVLKPLKEKPLFFFQRLFDFYRWILIAQLRDVLTWINHYF
jgi:hypothetical protein